jgi:hypothetical protein
MSFNNSLLFSGLLSQKATCLLIGPMKGEDSPTRERFNTIFEKIVSPAAKELGMEAKDAVADTPGMITSAIFKMIRHAHVIVADMTGENTNVGYELAFAHFLGKCTVPLIKGGGKLPFDIKDMSRIPFDPDDSSSLRSAAIDLQKYIREFAKAGWVSASNPIFHAAYAPPDIPLVEPYQNAFSAALGSMSGANPFPRVEGLTDVVASARQLLGDPSKKKP